MNRRNRAFSLLELQIASAIGFIILAAVLTLYVFSWKNFNTGNVLLDVYANSRNASGWLTRDIRSAAQVIGNYGAYTTTDNSIILVVPSIDASGQPVGSQHNDYIIYQLQGSDLYRIVQSDPLSSRPNSNDVKAHYCSSLTFSSGGVTLSHVANLSTVNTIAIYLPINKSTISLGGTGTETESITPTTVVRLRNK